MKKMKTIAILGFALMLIATFAYSETSRLGKTYPLTFNPTRVSAKTADYTLTTSDSEVDVTCTSADIVITLPALSSARANGSKVYKIKKADATTYVVTLTPATGETVGKESTRKILSQNGYIVVSSGPGSDWSVDYETPYIVEDHEAGTYTTGIGSGGLYSATSGSGTVTLTASDCGNIITMGTGTTTYSLPATVAKCEFTIINGVGGTASQMTIDPNTADNIYGGCTLASSVVTIDDTAGDSIVNTAATAVKGDYIRLVGDGNVGWYITGCQGIWAEN